LDPNTSFLPEYWIRKIFLTSIEITGKKKKKNSHANLFISMATIFSPSALLSSPPPANYGHYCSNSNKKASTIGSKFNNDFKSYINFGRTQG
jgi:hypothetical protein